MARRKDAGLARYFKPLQQCHSAKDACWKWEILERERYTTNVDGYCFAVTTWIQAGEQHQNQLTGYAKGLHRLS